LLRFVERHNVGMADALVAVSKHIGDVTVEALGLVGRDFQVIYNGVDTHRFRPQPLNRNAHEILYVGSLHRRKGIQELMRAWALVATEMPDARLTVVGRIPEGDTGQRSVKCLLDFIPRELRDTVSFVGYVPHEQLPLWYSRAAAAVFPSHAEAFGLTCAEAMACGAAVAMTSKGSGPELVEHGMSGLLVDPLDVEALAGELVYLLRNPDVRRELGTNARERACRLFDSEILVGRNLAFYRDTIRDYHAK